MAKDPANISQQFRTGNVVLMHGQAVRLTISAEPVGTRVYCVWFDANDHLQGGEFPVALLDHADGGEG